MYDPYNPLHEPIPKVPFHQPGLGGYGYFGEDEFGESTTWTEEILDLDEIDAILFEADREQEREYWMTEYPLTEEPECSRGPNGEIFIADASDRDGEVRYAECPDVSRIPPCEGGWWAKERLSEGSQGQMEMVWKCPTEEEKANHINEHEIFINEIKKNLTTMPDTELLELQYELSDPLELEPFIRGSNYVEQQLADLLSLIDQEVYRRSNPPPADEYGFYDWECPPDAICASPTETKPSFPVQDSAPKKLHLETIAVRGAFAAVPATIGFLVAKATNKNPLPYMIGGGVVGVSVLIGIGMALHGD